MSALESDRDPADVVVENGLLRLVTRHSDRDGWQWLSGQVSTRSFTQTYGYFEARMRYAGATGLNNGFWLETDAALAEGGIAIDIDQGHYPGAITMNLRRDGSQRPEHDVAPADLSQDFHLYGLEWLPNDRGPATLNWYFDGHLIRTIECAECDQPVRLLLGTAVMSNAKVAGPATTALDGKSMDVAFVRIYQLRRLMPVASAGAGDAGSHTALLSDDAQTPSHPQTPSHH